MKLTREKGMRMWGGGGSSGGSGGGGGSTAGYASMQWVDENYLSKEFFSRLFKAYTAAETQGDPDVEVVPNDTETTITNIQAMFGFWTEQYLSALGQGSGGGGGGISLNEPLASINSAGLASHPSASGQTIVWNGSAWTYGTAGGSGSGTVTSVGMTVPTGFDVSPGLITSSGTFAITFATGYSLPTTVKQTNWDTAYGWGNHANAGYALASNVYSKTDADAKFLTIAFFRSLFRAYTSSSAEVVPNTGDTTTIASIKAMFGFWTEQYISALGQGSGGGGGGISLNEPLASINSAGLASHPSASGQTIVWNGSAWVYGTAGGSGSGTVTSVGMTVPTGFNVSPGLITSSGTFSLTFATGYSLPTTAKQTNWDTAYGWGNHANAGYAAASAVVTALGTNGNYLTWTKNGTANNLTVPYATNCDTLDGIHAYGLLTGLSSSWLTNLSVTVGGNTLTVASLYSDYANELRYERTLWGQSFDGTANVSGSMTSVGDISLNNGSRIHHPNVSANIMYLGNASNRGWVKIADMCSQDDYIDDDGDSQHNWIIYSSDGNATFNGILSRGYVTALSDIRKKDILDYIDVPVQQIADAPIIRYTWKNGKGGHQIGSVAQYWRDVMPEAVPEDSDGYLSMDYGKLALISAISVARTVVGHDASIRELTREVERLRREIETIKAS